MKKKTDKKLIPGWVKLYRKITEWEWYDDPNVWKIFTHCILVANFKDKKWHGKIIKRGSFITSLRHLATINGLSLQQTRTALDKLEATQEITRKTTNEYTHITVNNYDKYQGNNTEDNKRITNEQQTNNKRITTTKEYKKDKKDKIILNVAKQKKYSSLKDIGEEEFRQVAGFYNVPLPFVRSCYDDLVNYCGAHGKRYKNYLMALRNFVKNDALKIRKEVNERVSKRGIDARDVK